MNADYHFVLH